MEGLWIRVLESIFIIFIIHELLINVFVKLIMPLISKGDTENPGFCYRSVSFSNIAINLSQYITNNLNTNTLYSCQHAWGTSKTTC